MQPLILTLLFSGVSAFNILCLLPYPGKSHHMVFEPLLRELTRRGHNLTVVSFFPKQPPEPRRRDVSLLELAEPFVEVVDLAEFESKFFGLERYFEHVPLVVGLARTNLDLCERLLEFRSFQEFSRGDGDYDLVLVEYFNSDCMMGVVHKYKAPHVGLMSHAILPWTASRHGFPDNPAYVPGMVLRVTDRMNFWERVENTFFHYFYNAWYRWEIRPKEQALLERKLGALPPLEAISGNASAVLVNTHPSLNGVKALVPAIVEVGGMHLHDKTPQPLPKRLERFMSEAADGVILVSFGSLIRSSSMPPHKLHAFLAAFASLKQRVVWKWEDESVKGLPGNVLAMKWVPQYDVLHHPSCVGFVSHGGLLSMAEAVSAGIPMLVVPILGDQFGNAAHARAAGLAVVLDYSRIDKLTLEQAVDEMLAPELRESAKRLRVVWHDRENPPLLTAAYWVERAARLRNSSQLSSYVRHMPLYQVLLLDVIAAFVVFLFVVFIVIYCILAKALSFANKNNKVKLS